VVNGDGLSFTDTNGKATGPSIASTGINAGGTVISNVADGAVNATSKEAVNGSQLYNAQSNVKNILGSSTTVDAAGNLTSS
ncbi:hypothetical protein M5F66_01075, partial [Acinetobacter sp. ANC 5033]|nr:hypothetical protein [Acinetobacter amyesii]